MNKRTEGILYSEKWLCGNDGSIKFKNRNSYNLQGDIYCTEMKACSVGPVLRFTLKIY